MIPLPSLPPTLPPGSTRPLPVSWGHAYVHPRFFQPTILKFHFISRPQRRGIQSQSPTQDERLGEAKEGQEELLPPRNSPCKTMKVFSFANHWVCLLHTLLPGEAPPASPGLGLMGLVPIPAGTSFLCQILPCRALWPLVLPHVYLHPGGCGR